MYSTVNYGSVTTTIESGTDGTATRLV